MAIAISRSVTQSTTTAGTFQALSALGAATVSSSFTVPTNVSSIKNLTVSFSVDAVFTAAAMVVGATATGNTSNNIQYDTDLGVVSGNSVELSLAGTQAATVDAAVTVTFA